MFVSNRGEMCVVFRQHRKLLDGSTAGGKLAPVAISPDEEAIAQSPPSQNECPAQHSQVPVRRPSVTTLVHLCVFCVL